MIIRLKESNFLGLQKEYLNNESEVKICCCNIEIAHKESDKFELYAKSDNYVVFKDLKEGTLEHNKNCILSKKFAYSKIDAILHRANQAKNLMDNILCNSNMNIFTVVYGPKGMGKETFVFSTLTYIFEREIINEFKCVTVNSFYDHIENIIHIDSFKGSNSNFL